MKEINRINFRMDPELYAEIWVRARDQKTTLSRIVRDIITDSINNKRNLDLMKNRTIFLNMPVVRILQALADGPKNNTAIAKIAEMPRDNKILIDALIETGAVIEIGREECPQKYVKRCYDITPDGKKILKQIEEIFGA